MYLLKKYVPPIYDNVKEYNELLRVQQNLLNPIQEEYKKGIDRQFVDTTDEVGLRIHEKIFDLKPTDTQDLNFRRQVVKLKYSENVPFTLPYLNGQLKKILGEGNFKTWCDYKKFELYIQAKVSSIDWFNQLDILVNYVKPANLLFIYQAYIPNKILLNETLRVAYGKYNYELGKWQLGKLPFFIDNTKGEYNYALGNWKLGEKPFRNIKMEVFKLASQSSVKEKFLNLSAEYAKSIISKIVLNDNIEILRADFDIVEVSKGVLVIEVVVPPTNLKTITNLKTFINTGEIITESNFILPVYTNVRIRQELVFEEGVN